MENIKINDDLLRSKRVISGKDIYSILPEEIKTQVEKICVVIDNGQPVWVILLNEGTGGYRYYPYSGELLYDPYANVYHFGKIYFGRMARYLRWTQTPAKKNGLSNKIYSIYFCTCHHMILTGEVFEYWMMDEYDDPGCSTEFHFHRIKDH